MKGGDGQLDEHQAHIFLEKKGEAATVVEFREKMKQIDLDFNKRVSVAEYPLTSPSPPPPPSIPQVSKYFLIYNGSI